MGIHINRGHITIQVFQMYPNSTKTIYIILSLSLSLLLAACQSSTPVPDGLATSPPPDETPTPAPTLAPTATIQATLPAAAQAAAEAVSLPLSTGGTAILGLVGQPASLNPLLENNPTLRELSPLLFDSLLRVDPNTAMLQPGLAQSWEYSADGQQVIFRLSPNLQWSNGDPLGAGGVIDSLRATQHPALLAFSDIRAQNNDTLEFTFAAINCSAVTTLGLLPLLPSSQITTTVPTGSGPFTVAEWSENRRSLTLARNPNYHRDPPALEGLLIRFLAENEINIVLSEGQFDLIGPLQAPLPNYTLPPHFTDLTYPSPQLIYLAINFAPKNEAPVPPKVRQALLTALDRESIFSEVLAGDGQLMASSLLPGHWAADQTAEPPIYDPVAAQALLAEAGLRDSDGDGWLDQQGQRVEIEIRANGQNQVHQALAWLISSYYREVGLFARAEGVAIDSIIDDLFTHDFKLALFTWLVLPDPDQTVYWHSDESAEGFGLNFTSYGNPRLDRLLERANARPNCAPADRVEVYSQVQQILSQERPVDFLLAANQHLFVANRLKGLQPGPFMPLTWNVSEWSLQAE